MLCKDAILEFLKEKNINDIFYLPGIHTVSLNTAFNAHNINVYMGRHESDLIYMADGYSRRTNKIGVIFVTPGPGLGNVVSGCMEAYYDNTPIIVFHIDTKRHEHGRGILHELKEPENMFKYFTKKSLYVSKIDELLPTLNQAYTEAVTDRKGPVVISIPFVFLDKEVTYKHDTLYEKTEKWQKKDSYDQGHFIEDIDRILKNKQTPLIIGGKSLMFKEAVDIIDKICVNSSIPFLTTTGGKGILDERLPYAFGNIMKKGMTNKMIKEADIVLAIGTRLRDVDGKRRGVKIKELIHIDIDDTWFGKNYETVYAVAGKLLDVLKDLELVFKKRRFQWNLKVLKEEQKKEEGLLSKNAIGYKAIKTIRDSIPEETITVWDLNLISYWAEYYFPVYGQRTFFMPRGISPIFYALPAAIGVKIGAPKTPCLTVCGDGGILPNLSELSLIKKYNIPLTIIVYNNNSYGILEDVLNKRYGIKNSMRLANPDFVRLSRAFEIRSKKIKTLEGLKKILLKEINWDEPFLIECEYPLFSPPWDI